ncbi:MAG: hypothetical protein H0W58_00370 [Acidobacteria bacterium]|nr:hypothetical protein [Acidobacteriota bacterium]
MRKILALTIALISMLTTFAPDSMAQTRRKRKKHRGLATNIAIIGGSTAVGAILGRGRNLSLYPKR